MSTTKNRVSDSAAAALVRAPASDAALISTLTGATEERAARVLDAAGGVAALVASTVPRGLTRAQERRLAAACELARRAASSAWERGERYTSGADVFRRYGPLLNPLRNEVFVVIGLDTRNRRVSEHQISVGTLSSCTVHPREAFVPLLRDSAAAVIFVHNHPSGDPTPSGDDIALTIRLRDVGDMVGIRVLDHVVVADEGYVSLADRGYLK